LIQVNGHGSPGGGPPSSAPGAVGATRPGEVARPDIDRTPAPLRAELEDLRRQLEREKEARRLAELVAGHGVDEVLRQQREVLLLGRVAVAANEATSLPDAARESLELLARHAAWPAATLWLRDPVSLQLRPSGCWYLDRPDRLSLLVEAVAARLTLPRGSVPSQVAITGAPMWRDGLDAEPSWLCDERDSRLGVRCALAVPVWDSGMVVGVIALFHDDEQVRDSGLLELVEQVGTQLGVVVRRCSTMSSARALAAAVASTPAVETGASSRAREVLDLAVVAHQVRTPLNGIIGHLELLCSGETLEAESLELAQVALQSALDLHEQLEAWMSGRREQRQPDQSMR
jgi:hypothetical protein